MSLVLGLLSGTSADGIDAALVRIQKTSPLKIKTLKARTYPFPEKVRQNILSLKTAEQVCRLNFELGELFAEAALKLCRESGIAPKKISAIGSHGQTIVHLGRNGTLQIGEPSIIAARTGITTVADFRPSDIAVGGEGAPLTPYLNYLLFKDSGRNIAVHNLGGISNLTWIPKGGKINDVVGFDTGPGNMVLDGLMQIISKGRFKHDPGGRFAAQGKVSEKWLEELMRHPFFRQKPPKTAGREEFGALFLKSVWKRAKTLRLSPQDTVTTVTALTARSIAENYRRFVFPRGLPDEIIFCGGGTHNKTLMKRISRDMFPLRVTTLETYGISVDFAEAVCFALLAHETLEGRPSNIPSVTGAKKQVVLGKVVSP